MCVESLEPKLANICQLTPPRPALAVTYGMLVYKLLGANAESSFARSFGISWGMGQATEWVEISKEAAKTAIIMAVLERVFLSPNIGWVEAHVDYLACQAAIAGHKLGLIGRVRMHFAFTRRFAAAE